MFGDDKLTTFCDWLWLCNIDFIPQRPTHGKYHFCVFIFHFINLLYLFFNIILHNIIYELAHQSMLFFRKKSYFISILNSKFSYFTTFPATNLWSLKVPLRKRLYSFDTLHHKFYIFTTTYSASKIQSLVWWLSTFLFKAVKQVKMGRYK